MNEILQKVSGEGHGWRDRDWDKLLSCIEENTLIPIIGRDLPEVLPEGAPEPVHLFRYIAETLVAEISINPSILSPAVTLSDVVYTCLEEKSGITSISGNASLASWRCGRRSGRPFPRSISQPGTTGSSSPCGRTMSPIPFTLSKVQ